MTPEELKNLIQVSDNRLELPIDTLGSAPISALFNPYLPQDKLVIRDVTRHEEAASQVTVVGTGDALPFLGMTVTAVFKVENQELKIVIQAAGATTWTFAQSFPDLRNTLFENLHFTAPQLTLTSYDLSEQQKAGMSFGGTLVIDTRLALLDLLFQNVTHAVYGDIKISAGMPYVSPEIDGVPDIVLYGPEGTTLDLTLFQLAQLRYEIFGDPRINYDLVDLDVMAYMAITGAVQFQAQNQTHQVFITTEMLNPGGGLLFRADFSDAGDVALHEIESFIGHSGLSVPFDFDIAQLVRFTDFQILLEPGDSLVRYVSMTLETQEEWTIVENLLTLEAIDVTFRINNPISSPQVTGLVGGLVGIGESGTLELSIDFDEKSLGGGLREGDPPLSMREVYTHFTGNSAEHFPNLSVAVFDFFLQLADTTAGRPLTYQGLLELEGDWEIAEHLRLLDVKFSLDHADTTKFLAAASFMIQNIAVYIEAKYEDPAKGWEFAGETGPGQAIPIGHLIDTLGQQFGALALPQPIAELTILNLGVAFNTGQQRLHLTAEAKFPIDQTQVDIVVTIDTYDRSFGGHIMVDVPIGGQIHHLRFDLSFVKGTASTVFVATYSHAQGDPVPTVKDIVHAFSPATAEHIPDGIAVDIRDVVFAFVQTDQKNIYLFGVDIDVSIDLSHLPLVGDQLPPSEVVGVHPLQLLVASAEFLQPSVALLNGLIPQTVNKLPDGVLPQGFTIGATLQLGSFSQPLTLPVANQSGPVTQPPATPTQAQTDDKTLWYKIQRNFGPLHFERVGFQYQTAAGQKAVLLFLLDAALSAAGLTLALDGLSIGFSLADLAAIPSFSLRGLAIDYKSGPIEIGGAFLKSSFTYNNKSYTAYSGRALLKAETLTIGALGSYVQLDEGPSLFVYAFLDYPIGGPAFFFVRGLAAGFGYNRRLISPTVDRIADFPLVAEASGQMQPASLADELSRLQSYLPPSVGDYFLAVGIRFTTFEMIDSFILVAVAFGHRFELNILGLSTMILPAPDAASAGITPLAEIQLALRATFVPDDGFFGISAQLTPNSFLLSRDCHLTGGFAFYSWFGDQNPGDFVLTVGGYHPRFARPSHYPVVPRLGFNWQVNSNLLLKGSAYYALTPSMLMAGGALNATWQDGNLKAWFDASMDFLIAWKPFHYEVDFHISVGASYTFHFFGTHHITAHVGADISIWGPEFSGVARVDLSIVSFTIRFIKTPKGQIQAQDWPHFRQSFLPEDAKVCTIAIRGGMAHGDQAADAAPSSDALVMINPHELVLATDSVIPSKAGARGAVGHDAALPTTGATLTVGVGPMNRQAVEATHRIIITYGGEAADDWFEYRPLTKSLPFALWGGVLRPALNQPQLVADMLTGYEIRPKAPLEPSNPPTIARSALQKPVPVFSEHDAYEWKAPTRFVAVPDEESKRRETIGRTIVAQEVATRRAALAGALLADATLDLGGFDTADFLAIPLVSNNSPT